LEAILEARAYLTAKQTYETSARKEDLPKHWPMLDEVKRIDFKLAREAMRG